MRNASTILTITQLNNQVKYAIENKFRRLWVEGEISQPRKYPSGHVYFTLKDSGSEISAVLFSGRQRETETDIAHGAKVVAYGAPTLYLKRGQYQFVVDVLYPAGKGDLWLAYEELKKKLEAEGLFDASLKKPIPQFPRRVGVVTSGSGSVLRDIIHVITRRAPHVDILVRPAQVQGEGADADLAQGIRDLNEYGSVDVIIIGRGGGSLEDLWCFNSELLARTIHYSRIPVISAVGHETDFTISDFVADMRAPTPSAAAEMAVPVRTEWLQWLDETENRISDLVQTRIHRLEAGLNELKNRYGFRNPMLGIQKWGERLNVLSDKLILSTRTALSRRNEDLKTLRFSLVAHHPGHQLIRMNDRLQSIRRDMYNAVKNHLQKRNYAIASFEKELMQINPFAVLKRGYSIVQDENDRVITDKDQVQPGHNVSLTLSRGKLLAEIKEKFNERKTER